MNKYAPKSWAESRTICDAIVASGLFPSVKSASAAMVLMATGDELGLGPIQSLMTLHSVQGKINPSADALVGMVKCSPLCRWFRLVESTTESATYETWRTGDPQPTRYTYTIAMGREAGLASRDSWQKYPAAMLRARCASTLARVVYPDVVTGWDDGPQPETAPEPVAPAPEPVAPAAMPAPARALPALPVEYHEPPRRAPAPAEVERRALLLSGMSTREAARYIASMMVSRGAATDLHTGVSVLALGCEARGIQPQDATLELLLEVWLQVQP